MQQQSGPTSRVLVVMRHAKAEPDGPTDFERRLSERGRTEARAAGRWLASRGITPDHALVSAALRTVETWEAVAEVAGWPLEATYDQGLYAAGPETALDLIRASPTGAGTVIVIGHNPTIAYLAQLLDDGEGDVAAVNEMAVGYPTSALTVFEHDGGWAGLGAGSARVAAFHVGRG